MQMAQLGKLRLSLLSCWQSSHRLSKVAMSSSVSGQDVSKTHKAAEQAGEQATKGTTPAKLQSAAAKGYTAEQTAQSLQDAPHADINDPNVRSLPSLAPFSCTKQLHTDNTSARRSLLRSSPSWTQLPPMALQALLGQGPSLERMCLRPTKPHHRVVMRAQNLALCPPSCSLLLQRTARLSSLRRACKRPLRLTPMTIQYQKM